MFSGPLRPRQTPVRSADQVVKPDHRQPPFNACSSRSHPGFSGGHHSLQSWSFCGSEEMCSNQAYKPDAPGYGGDLFLKNLLLTRGDADVLVAGVVGRAGAEAGAEGGRAVGSGGGHRVKQVAEAFGLDVATSHEHLVHVRTPSFER